MPADSPPPARAPGPDGTGPDVTRADGTGAGVVVVGAGLAGANVVQTLRKEGYPGTITLIGAEPVAPYERPPLSKEYLQGSKPREKVFVHDEAWYAGRRIDTRFGQRVTAIDRGARSVRLDTGESLAYGTLVLATGSEPRRPAMYGADLPGVHTLRRLEDADALRSAFHDGGRLAIVGAGWIGMEVAASARQAGMEVTVVAPGDVPLGRPLGHRMGEYFAALHRAHGVRLRMGASVRSVLEQDGRAVGLVVENGTPQAGALEADLVLLAVGADPDTALAEAAGLAVDHGVLTDERLRTEDPHILAVGDIANAYNTALGTRLRVEHWDNAIRQGRLAARTILGAGAGGGAGEAGGAGTGAGGGGGAVYDWQPYFFTDQFELGMEYVGHASPEARAVIRGDTEWGEFIVFYVEGGSDAEGAGGAAGAGTARTSEPDEEGTDGVAGTVTAAMNVNVWDVNDTLRGILGRTVDVRRLQDPTVDLTDL